MNIEKGLTRREAIQGLLGAAVTVVAPISAYTEQTKKGMWASWPNGASEPAGRLQAFNDSWRFHRGDVEEASLLA